MSEEKSGPNKPPHDIDLGKDAVKDVTPVADHPEPLPAPPPKPDLKPSVPPPTPEAGGRAMPVIGGAVAGGVLGLLSAVFFQHFERPAVTVADPRVAQVEAAIAAVERRAADVAQLEQRVQSQVKAIEGRATASGQQAESAMQRAGAVESRATALEQKISGVEQKAAAAEQRAVGAEQKAAEFDARANAVVAPVAERLKAVEGRIAEGREQAAALSRRVDLLAQIEPPKVDLRPVITRVEELERTLTGTAARVTLSGEAAIAVDARVKALEQGIKGLDGSAAANNAAIAAMGSSLKALEAAVASAGKRSVETASAVVAVADLARRMIQQGEQPAGAVAALRSLGVTEASLKPVAVLASQPAMAPAALADLYADLAGKIPRPQAPTAQPKTDSIVDRVTSGLWSQVDVRAVGTADKVDPTGLAPQVRQRLLAGDLRGAQALVAALGPEQQAGLKRFSDVLAARIDALAALAGIEREALATPAQKG